MEKVTIDEVEYPIEVVKVFCATSDNEFSIKSLREPPQHEDLAWHHGTMRSHLATFYEGWKLGHESAMEEAPDCDDCDIYEKVAEAGPPAGDHSNRDR